MESFNDGNATDIYALSFWKDNSEDDPRYPCITVSYNTYKNMDMEKDHASNEREAKWNFAYWLQNDLLTIGGEEDKDLADWFSSENLYYTDEQLEDAEDDEKKWDKLAVLDENMQALFMDVIIDISRRLHQDGIIKKKFGKDIPVIIHELEYYDLPVGWTEAGNPEEVIAEFVEWYENDICG
ncbi:hypothetical protein D0T84_14235 [Dysgonomonas sp. 521]|nr:hypothetical protein [Dysgonomonas sp. 521]